MVLQCICIFCIKNSNLFKDTRKTKATVGLFVVSVHSIGHFFGLLMAIFVQKVCIKKAFKDQLYILHQILSTKCVARFYFKDIIP